MPKFSANLGFLWTDRSLPDAIFAAKTSGFGAVECHFPYAYPPADIARALNLTGLRMVSLNTCKGDSNAGLAALPDAIVEAREGIDQALRYGQQICARNIHVMAGQISGDKAEETYINNLLYASDAGSKAGLEILIEPLNPFDMPGYFLRDTEHAQYILKRVNRQNVKLMFDCYHVGRTEKKIEERFISCLPQIGHIQFAAVPDRGPPDHGDVNYHSLFKFFDQQGWNRPLGAEYLGGINTDSTLGWLHDFF